MKSLTARLTKNTKKSRTKNRPKDWYREIIQNQQINPNTGGCLKPTTTRPAKIVWVKNNNNSGDDESKEKEEAVWFIHKNLTRAFLFCCIFIYMRTHERALSSIRVGREIRVCECAVGVTWARIQEGGDVRVCWCLAAARLDGVGPKSANLGLKLEFAVCGCQKTKSRGL